MTPRTQKLPLAAIIGLALLTALSLGFPPAAPFAGAVLIAFVGLNFWTRYRWSQQTNAREHREPNLWDDGFGAT